MAAATTTVVAASASAAAAAVPLPLLMVLSLHWKPEAVSSPLVQMDREIGTEQNSQTNHRGNRDLVYFLNKKNAMWRVTVLELVWGGMRRRRGRGGDDMMNVLHRSAGGVGGSWLWAKLWVLNSSDDIIQLLSISKMECVLACSTLLRCAFLAEQHRLTELACSVVYVVCVCVCVAYSQTGMWHICLYLCMCVTLLWLSHWHKSGSCSQLLAWLYFLWWVASEGPGYDQQVGMWPHPNDKGQVM